MPEKYSSITLKMCSPYVFRPSRHTFAMFRLLTWQGFSNFDEHDFKNAYGQKRLMKVYCHTWTWFLGLLCYKSKDTSIWVSNTIISNKLLPHCSHSLTMISGRLLCSSLVNEHRKAVIGEMYAVLHAGDCMQVPAGATPMQ